MHSLLACGALSVDGRAMPGQPIEVLAALVEELRPDVVVDGNAYVRRLQFGRSIGHALARWMRSDVVIVDTVSQGATTRRRSGSPTSGDDARDTQSRTLGSRPVTHTVGQSPFWPRRHRCRMMRR